MNKRKAGIIVLLVLSGTGAWVQGQGVDIDASQPQSTAISIYDTGFGLVSELRRVTPASGENTIRIRQLPSALEPSTISFFPIAGAPGFQILEQLYRFDASHPERLLQSFAGRTIRVVTKSGELEGRLVSFSSGPVGQRGALAVMTEDGHIHVIWDAEDIERVILPDAVRYSFLEPTLLWRAQSSMEGPQNMRLTYQVRDMDWKASYEVILDEAGQRAYFAGRIGLANNSGGAFQNAQIQLISTERGMIRERAQAATRRGRDEREVAPAQRYTYGMSEPAFEQSVISISPVHSYRLSEPVSLADGDLKFVHYTVKQDMPVSRFYVYDGVRFDRFQRNRRNDWNYGTESHTAVETHVQFLNTPQDGPGLDLPTGLLRLYQRRSDGSMDLIGEDMLLSVPANMQGHALLGTARGLRGERERTGYVEITPLRVYEESFQIRIENDTDETVEVRVVEHLYRWHDFEIVRADAEYEVTGPQTIEFRPTLRPGGRRTISYTVRYSW